MARLTKAQVAERDEARELLRGMLKPGDRIRCVLRSVSRSGMSRCIDFYSIQTDDKGTAYLAYLTGLIANACGYKRASQGLKVGGCGMDMGFAVVYELGATLWPKGTDKPHGTRNGEPDSDGGYTLKSEWI